MFAPFISFVCSIDFPISSSICNVAMHSFYTLASLPIYHYICQSETLESLKIDKNDLISGSISYFDDMYLCQIGQCPHTNHFIKSYKICVYLVLYLKTTFLSSLKIMKKSLITKYSDSNFKLQMLFGSSIYVMERMIHVIFFFFFFFFASSAHMLHGWYIVITHMLFRNFFTQNMCDLATRSLWYEVIFM